LPVTWFQRERDKLSEGVSNAPLALSAIEDIQKKAGGDGVRQAELKAKLMMSRADDDFEATKRLIEMKTKKDFEKLHSGTGASTASPLEHFSNEVRKKKIPVSTPE
jgi:hypothetical protein